MVTSPGDGVVLGRGVGVTEGDGEGVGVGVFEFTLRLTGVGIVIDGFVLKLKFESKPVLVFAF